MIEYIPTPTVSAASNITSAPIDLGDIINFSVQANISGSDVVGTFHLEVSNDGSTWFDLSGATDSVSASSDVFLNVNDAGYRYVRYDWAYTSGTGNITVYYVGKGRLPRTTNKRGL